MLFHMSESVCIELSPLLSRFFFEPGDPGSNPGGVRRSELCMSGVDSYLVSKNEYLLKSVVTSGGITRRYLI